MAQIELRLSSKVQKDTGRSEVLIRLFQGNKINLRGKTGIFILPSYFEYYIDRDSTKNTCGIIVPQKTETITKADAIKKKYIIFDRGEIIVRNRIETDDSKYHNEMRNKIDKLKEAIIESFNAVDKEMVSSNWLVIVIDKYNHPEKYLSKAERVKKKSFFALFEEYIQKQQHAFDQIKGYHVLMRILCRYEEYRRIMDKKKGFKLDIDTLDKETIEDFRDYIRDEKSLADEYPTIFEGLLSKYPLEINIKARSPKLVERGTNTVIKLMKKFKTFFNWLNKQGITNNHPFDGITIGTETYGTPIYITLEERNQIADYDLSNTPELAIQRDIFIFQSLIGCRVGDLLKMTKSNIVGDAIEFIAHKTKDERPVTLHVPLNDRAKVIIDKYKDCGDKLLPFITDQKYNVAIKKVFTACGITRTVTILNPTTGEYEQKPINEVASSHMARRTFVGNLYKQVKDPNLVGALSGHVPGSKAFTRYRDIDNDIKRELVDLIK